MMRQNISKITYADIESLLDNEIDENDVLDYKEEMIDKHSNLIKDPDSFFNYQ